MNSAKLFALADSSCLSSMRPRARIAGVPERLWMRNRSITSGNSELSCRARSASPYRAQVLTIELRSSR
jgi:hypothetical protein